MQISWNAKLLYVLYWNRKYWRVRVLLYSLTNKGVMR
jgi:hypothetical protein